MEECKVCKLFNLNETIAKELLEGVTYPWEVLEQIGDYILELGEKLDPKKYEKKGDNIWIAKNAKIMQTAYIRRANNYRRKCSDKTLCIY